uniref:NADH-ubiquinone oxidoreductase chain 3 n=1 Tax=Ophioplinthus brevirima TaxID=1795459 RepID=A0A3G2WI90_9ECHI|nr:NADH dehydrogenase subunit 3 [Ophioplinthus brevirima]AYO99668.1 NADH dehydrogenase subunit 3 [Ophioplinthus brevirima]
MTLIISYSIICFLLTIILIIIGQILPSNNPDIQKVSPYECGFDPINSSRLPFSFRFFLIALLFLLFDLEIAILLPLPLSTSLISINNSSYTLILFLLILTIGLIYEWINGGLDWANN